MKKILALTCAIATPLFFSQSAFAEFDYFKTDGSFKRFSVSAGWLHAAPQGTANPLQNTTAIKDGTVAENGSVKVKTVRDVLVKGQKGFGLIDGTLGALGAETDLSNVLVLGDVSGTTEISGLESWSSAGTGLQADDADTVGLLFNYYLTDNWSMELKAGIPPKVDILGKGQVFAPLTGKVSPSGIAGGLLGDFEISKDIPITNLEQGDGVASSARAWLPAAEVHYQFGKSGVNKFRPYVGAGVLYAYFNDIELNPGIRQDLEIAGHQIQNIKDNKAGAALEDVKSASGMSVDVEADSAFAPIVTLGATYDFNDRWFGVGSISYAKLNSDTTITVKNDAGEELIRSSTTLDIDPYITYLGVGYRF
ncbi:OmpW/AlkL family protein [Psychrobacter sp. DAB_AL43B]|uniref:OmpW/AlkL family protein n=1 Tax=Psychrobacter sp. DAB_AL43B TaxID=1028416 RepID=UPI0009A88949|nr:OmpW family outer membrane protein [Psychrobacter sp. DAB_AL43B]SLJ85894.1 outer membrane protein W [Psychrobacter sp. DAB_AL43B]